MIDLTPLDVRKKRGDFRKALRGYDPEDVDAFLDLVAERLEEIVKENLTLRERSERLNDQVSSQQGREKAVQDALVTAQQLRDEIRGQAQREADEVRSRAEREADDMRVSAEREARLVQREAESEARRLVQDAERRLEERQAALEELERNRLRFLKSFRQLLRRELDLVEVEEGRAPLEEVAVEMDLGGGRSRGGSDEAAPPFVDRDAPPFVDEDHRPDPDAPIHELAGPDQPDGEVAGPDEPDGEVVGPDEPGHEPDLWLSSVLREEEHEDEEGTR